MSNLKDAILENMTYSDYRRYYEQELGELGKMNSSGWVTALCPFHDDTDPSMNVNFFSEGAWRCHACGETGDLFSFHEKKHNTDFKGALDYFANFLGIDPENIPKKKKPAAKKKQYGKLVKVYSYFDLNGKIRHETCRYDPKDFNQRRPHPTKQGEYIWSLKGIELIPYNLPSLVKSDTIYIVEGERDADRLMQIGLTSTCNAQGAGKWPDSLTPYFKGKTVIILPDNDQPGKAHAELVAQKLTGTAKSIQIVNLPNLPPGGDVSDWLNAGNTKADLLEVINQAKPYEDHITFLNKRHAVVMHSGKCLILNEEIDPIFNRQTITFSSIPDFHTRYFNKRIPNPAAGFKGQAKDICIVTDWLKSSDRREYERIVFAPKKNVNGCYNLWKGFAIEPKQGDWSLFQDHIFHIIAEGNQYINDWILTWMARICQDPGGKRPKTALVLRGDQGVGKGVFLSNFGKLFGNHFLQINNQQHLTSRFNHHLKDVIFLFVDEGFWAGDKASEGALKGLITEDILPIEGKGKDVIMLQNHINLAMASNNDWVVPSGLMERRFMVLDVSNIRQQDHEYFGAIDNQLKNGGYEAMLYDLLKYDIKQVDVSKILKTSAGFDQKIESMTPTQKFWFEKLRSGILQSEDNEWSELIQCLTLYTQYLQFCDWIGVRHKKIDRQFGKELKKLCPKLSRRYLKTTDMGADNYIYKWFYEFPSLEICRNLFENEVKMGLDWDQDAVFTEDSLSTI